MIYSADALRKDTVALITQVDKQIAELQAEADRMGVAINTVRDARGDWVLNPLLLTKAVAYNTLVMLQTTPPPRSSVRR